MNIIFRVNGGLGKAIMSTAVCARLKKKYPESKLIVLSPWPDVFLNNPNVDVNVDAGKGVRTFYKDYLDGNDNIYFIQDPYELTSHINNEKHLLDSWFSIIGEKYNGELPELYFDVKEQQYYSQTYKTSKPLFMIQPNGGGMKQDKYNWARDLPPNVVQHIIDRYSDEYTVGIIRTKDQIKYNNCVDLVEKWREVAIGMRYAKKRLLIDSSFQHIAAAMGLPSVVTWGVTDPNVFGYEMHTNIKALPYNKEQEPTGFMFRHEIVEPLQTMPYKSFSDVYDIDKIIRAIDEQ